MEIIELFWEKTGQREPGETPYRANGEAGFCKESCKRREKGGREMKRPVRNRGAAFLCRCKVQIMASEDLFSQHVVAGVKS